MGSRGEIDTANNWRYWKRKRNLVNLRGAEQQEESGEKNIRATMEVHKEEERKQRDFKERKG